MSKRYQPPKEFGRFNKKAKLDINVNRGVVEQVSLSMRQINFPRLRDSSPINGRNNFWDDEDDDVILLATQVAELQQTPNAPVTTNNAEISSTDITFSDFGLNVGATTSTQHLSMPAAAVVVDRSLSQLFDGDDEAFGNLELPEAFKKPTYQPKSKEVPPQRHALCTDDDAKLLRAENAERRHRAAENQLKLLTKRMDRMCAENMKLNQELETIKENMQMKAGEAALLRDELRHMKQQVQRLKMDKLLVAESVKNDCKTQMQELQHRIESHEAQLQMKSAEYASLRMRHADETRRLEDTICVTMQQQQTEPNTSSAIETSLATTVEEEVIEISEEEKYNLMLIDLELPQLALHVPPNLCGPAHIYRDNIKSENVQSHRNSFQIEMERLQLLMASVKWKQVAGEHIDATYFVNQIVPGAISIFPRVWKYVQTLEYKKYITCYASLQYDLTRYIVSNTTAIANRSLLQREELMLGESALKLRRYIAILAYACEEFPLVASKLLPHTCNDVYLLRILSSSVERMSYSAEICDHFVLLEAFATLLYSLIKQLPTTTVQNEELLAEFFKQLTFTRPNAWVFRELSAILLMTIDRRPSLIDKLCVNACGETFKLDRENVVYRFTNASCTLQVTLNLR